MTASIKFTKASKNDNFKVTVRTSQLFPQTVINQLNKGDIVLLDVEGVTTAFKVNRSDASTIATNSFPNKLFHPDVGAPINYRVTSVNLVK